MTVILPDAKWGTFFAPFRIASIIGATALLAFAPSRSFSSPVNAAHADAPWDFVQQRDRAYYIPNVAVDGRVEEWSAVPEIIHGHDTLTEASLSAFVRLGWSEQGLLCAIRTNSPREPGAAETRDWTNESVDLYIDTRPYGARMERYETGVRHLSVKPGADPAHAAFTEILPKNVAHILTHPSLSTCQAAFAAAANGWSCEILVPWEVLGVKPRSRGDWIAFSTRVKQVDPSTGFEYYAGAADVEPKNRLEDTPIAFSPVLLSDQRAGDDTAFTFHADETIIGGDPWLEIEVVAPIQNSTLSGAFLDLAVPEFAMQQRVAFRESIGGKYWIGLVRIPLRQVALNAETITSRLTVTDNRSKVWTRDVVTSCKVTRKLTEIDARLPKARIDALPPEKRGLVHLLKAGAEESARLLAFAPDGFRAPQRRFRSLFETGIYTRRIELFLNFGAAALAGKLDDSIFPLRAFQSEIDQEWLPVKVALPWNYDPNRRYPVCIYLYGKGQHRNRSEFMQGDLSAIAHSQFLARSGDSISIVPYQRNNAPHELERETLAYIFDRLLPTLPADRSRVGIYGGSAGAPQALGLAIRHPDKFAWVTSRGGDHSALLRECDGPHDGLMRNLLGSAINIQTGDTDGAITGVNQELLIHLQSIGVKVAYDELPATQHQFTPPSPPDLLTKNALPVDPDTVAVAFKNPDYGTTFWLAGDQLENWGESGRIQGNWTGEKLQIETANVRRLGVRRRPGGLPREVAIDAQKIDLSAAGNRHGELHFEKLDSSWRLVSRSSGRLGKNKGRSGPAWRIESAPLRIVYGTKSAKLAPLLRERAFRILSARLGGGDDQLGTGRFPIMSDTEALKAGWEGFNLWLIGSEAENLLVARIAESLPISSETSPLFQQFDPHTLMSYIYPLRGSKDGYCYVEIGNTPAAYFADCTPSSVADISIRTILVSGETRLHEASFDTWWKLPGAP